MTASVVISIAAAVLINIAVSGSLSTLLLALFYLTILVHVALLKCEIPGNVSAFFNYFLPIVLFDLIPTDVIYPKLFTLPDTDGPLTEQFDALDYFSLQMANNMGSLFIVAILSAPTMLLMKCL